MKTVRRVLAILEWIASGLIVGGAAWIFYYMVTHATGHE